jgi:hypothetical protein
MLTINEVFYVVRNLLEVSPNSVFVDIDPRICEYFQPKFHKIKPEEEHAGVEVMRIAIVLFEMINH